MSWCGSTRKVTTDGSPGDSALVRKAGERGNRRRLSCWRAVNGGASRQVGPGARQPRGDDHTSRTARRAHPKAHVWCGAASVVSSRVIVAHNHRVGGISWLECHDGWRGHVVPGAEHGRLRVQKERGRPRGRQPGHHGPAGHATRGMAVVGESEVTPGLTGESPAIGDADFQRRRGAGIDAAGRRRARDRRRTCGRSCGRTCGRTCGRSCGRTRGRSCGRCCSRRGLAAAGGHNQPACRRG